MQQLAGVGPQLAARLARLGLRQPRDLLLHLPQRYQDRTRVTAIADLHTGMEALVVGQIESAEVKFARRRSLVARIRDHSGAVWVRFFHFSQAMRRGLVAGAWLQCYGKCGATPGDPGRLTLLHPEYQVHKEKPVTAAAAALTPIYPGTEGISAILMRKLVAQALATELTRLDDCLPAEILRKFNLPKLQDALRIAHRPPPDADADALVRGMHPARRRLALEELLAHHLALHRMREQHQAQTAPPFAPGSSWEKLKTSLGFELTAAQTRVVREILADLGQPTPAMRLLQGDVGSGKTVVAAAAALTALDAGFQTALMAPTELLAEQHRETFSRWFAPLGVPMETLTGKMPARARAAALQNIQTGRGRMIIGTHALFQRGVEFARLGLLIIDEQHRFGVGQRLALRNKATAPAAKPAAAGECAPHQLIMSATPIPRSLAMIFYADLAVSTLDEMPPGRKPVRTIALPNSRREEIAARVLAVCHRRQQVYWVCPLIEESDKLQAQAAEQTFAILTKLLPAIKIELIHGRLHAARKEEIMRRFARGEIDLLVATTVIEVGVDVPRASLMVIENAERLGLAQLHQLRGRVGRGREQATCALLYQPPLGALARERIGIIRATNDGFAIARKDLEQRGPGELLGTRQTGLQPMKIADLARDRALLPQVERIGAELRAQHPEAVDEIIARWMDTRAAYAEV